MAWYSTRAIKTGFALFSNPLQYRYKIEETGETFTSTKSNTKDAYQELMEKITCRTDRDYL